VQTRNVCIFISVVFLLSCTAPHAVFHFFRFIFCGFNKFVFFIFFMRVKLISSVTFNNLLPLLSYTHHIHMYISRLCAKLHCIARRISFFPGLFCMGFISLYFSFLMAVKLPRSITSNNQQPLLSNTQYLYMYISRFFA